jgi:hypothetical protein
MLESKRKALKAIAKNMKNLVSASEGLSLLFIIFFTWPLFLNSYATE